MHRTLVFGGTGFIGEYVLREMDHLGEQYSVVAAATPDAEKKLEGAIHVLWLVPPVEGLLERFSEAILNARKLKRFVFASTLFLYAEGSAQSEAAPLDPSNAYERAKKTEEETLQRVFAEHPEKLVIARLANVYGDVKNTGVVGKIFSALRDGGIVTINGDGSQVRDFIHVEDVARLLAALLFAKDASGAYNVSTGKLCALNEVLAKAEMITGKKLHIVHGPAVPEKHSVAGDNTKIMQLLGISVQETLDTGLRKTYKHYQ